MSIEMESQIKRIKELAFEYFDDHINAKFVMVGLEYEQYMKEWHAALLYDNVSGDGKANYVDNEIMSGSHSTEDKNIVMGRGTTLNDALDDLEGHLKTLLKGRDT